MKRDKLKGPEENNYNPVLSYLDFVCQFIQNDFGASLSNTFTFSSGLIDYAKVCQNKQRNVNICTRKPKHAN